MVLIVKMLMTYLVDENDVLGYMNEKTYEDDLTTLPFVMLLSHHSQVQTWLVL